MKTVTLLAVVTALAGTSGFLIKVPTAPLQPVVGVAPVGWVHLQKLILPLFENVCEDSTNPTIVKLAQEFIVDSSSGLYLKPDVVDNLWNLRDGKGFLPKGEIFTEYNFNHMNELKTIYDVFYFSKNFDTFYKTAAWARQNINCGVFVDAIYLAVLNRRDTEKLSVPAPYELLPNYFIPKDIISKASSLLSGEMVTQSETIPNEGNAYVLDTNYTSNVFDKDDESKLAYFHEDIGLNTHHFLQKLKKAPWFNPSTDKTARYGENLYHMMKQLSARYNLERYANGLEMVARNNWDSFAATPYDPKLIYSNGNDFSQRTTELSISDELAVLRTIESNVVTEVNRMVIAGYNKTEILNHVMEILVAGDKSYETVLRKVLGKDTGNNGQPSVLEHYMTTLRDPVFWKINQNIVDLVDDALRIVPSYTRNELYFPGVEVLNIEVKKIMTMFDYFQFDVTDALQSATANTAFQVKIGQTRLSHKPFVVKLNISSLVTHKGYVKIFLGPKTAPGQLAMQKDSFILLDSFEYKFKIGSNVVSRSSQDMVNISEDFPLLRTLRKKVEDAEFGLDALSLNPIESAAGFPSRLILPKGTPEGLPLQLFVFVAPFVKSTISGSLILPNTEFNSAILSSGYPLDLDIEDSMLFKLPNALVKDIVVTHKDDKKPGSEGTGGYKREPFDYSSKIGQYGNKEDYSAKRSGTYYEGKQDSYGKKEILDTTLTSNDILLEKEEINVGYKREPFDYSSKKGQYGNKGDYSAKRSGSYYEGKQDSYGKKEIVDTTLNSNDKLAEKVEVNNKGAYEDIQHSKYYDGLVKAYSLKDYPETDIHTYEMDPNKELIHKSIYDETEKHPSFKMVQSKRVPTFLDYLISQTENGEDVSNEVYE